MTKLVGDISSERQPTMLGHVLTRPQDDFTRYVTCDQNLGRPYHVYKRTGHPRDNWVTDNLQRLQDKFGTTVITTLLEVLTMRVCHTQRPSKTLQLHMSFYFL